MANDGFTRLAPHDSFLNISPWFLIEEASKSICVRKIIEVASFYLRPTRLSTVERENSRDQISASIDSIFVNVAFATRSRHHSRCFQSVFLAHVSLVRVHCHSTATRAVRPVRIEGWHELHPVVRRRLARGTLFHTDEVHLQQSTLRSYSLSHAHEPMGAGVVPWRWQQSESPMDYTKRLSRPASVPF